MALMNKTLREAEAAYEVRSPAIYGEQPKHTHESEKQSNSAVLDKTLQDIAADYEIRLVMTYDEWRTQISESRQSEWVDGEAIVFMPPSRKHQDVTTFLAALLRNFADHFQLGKVIAAPFEMRPNPFGNAREPDLLFVANENLSLFDDQRLNGPADLAVEVVSPESVGRDTERKFTEYEAAGVREYWIVDPRAGREQAQFFVLDEKGRYREALVEDGIYCSTVLDGFWLKVDWLWPGRQPAPVSAFAEIVGLPAEMVDLLRGMQRSSRH